MILKCTWQILCYNVRFFFDILKWHKICIIFKYISFSKFIWYRVVLFGIFVDVIYYRNRIIKNWIKILKLIDLKDFAMTRSNTTLNFSNTLMIVNCNENVKNKERKTWTQKRRRIYKELRTHAWCAVNNNKEIAELTIHWTWPIWQYL